jgi:hypothetical protein
VSERDSDKHDEASSISRARIVADRSLLSSPLGRNQEVDALPWVTFDLPDSRASWLVYYLCDPLLPNRRYPSRTKDDPPSMTSTGTASPSPMTVGCVSRDDDSASRPNACRERQGQRREPTASIHASAYAKTVVEAIRTTAARSGLSNLGREPCRSRQRALRTSMPPTSLMVHSGGGGRPPSPFTRTPANADERYTKVGGSSPPSSIVEGPAYRYFGPCPPLVAIRTCYQRATSAWRAVRIPYGP